MSTRIVLAALVLGAATAAQASSLQCADPTATAVYTAGTYDGGAPPPPFAVTRTEEATVAGRSLGKNEFSEEAGWKRTFTAAFDEGTRVELGKTADQAANRRTTTYAISLTLTPNAGSVAFSGLVICAETEFIIPPP